MCIFVDYRQGEVMKIAICDDEMIFLEQMEELLKGCKDIQCIDKYDNIDALNEMLPKIKYDVIFMDIEWNKGKENGTHYAAKINEKYSHIQIIYVTAYNDRFSEAIFWEPSNLCGYLVKPIKYEKLLLLLDKARKNIEQQEEEQLALSYNGVSEIVSFHDIIFMESRAHQLFVYTRNKTISLYGKLDDYEDKMQRSFLRIHKSFLVNMNVVKRIERKEMCLKTGIALPISKSRYKDVKDRYFKYMGEQL